jgi:hypothetical protein
MKKTRINLQEQFPNYFATAAPSDPFAELGEDDVKRLGTIDAALAKVSELESENEKLIRERDEALAASATAQEAAEQTVDEKINEKFASLQGEIALLKEKLEQSPAAVATVIGQDSTQEGGGQASAARPKSSVEQELDRINGIK